MGLPLYSSVRLRECVTCQLVFYGPLVDLRPAYANGDYTGDHASYLSTGEDRVFAHIAKRRARWLLEHVPPGPLLELGPGPGFFLGAAKDRGFVPVGVEPSPALAGRAVSRFGVDVRRGFLDEVDLPHDRFDAICMFHVFEHVEEPLELLNRIAGLLSERGVLAMEVPNLDSAMARHRADRWAAVQPYKLHISHFTAKSLSEVVRRAGFEIVALDTVAPWDYIPPGARWRPRALLGYAFRAARLRTLRSTHPRGFDHLRLVARYAPATA